MTEQPLRPTRLYGIPAAAAAVLGIVALVAHLRQPALPVLPGRGCIVTAFPSPDSLYLPQPYLELRACLHISETTLELYYFRNPEEQSGLFDASGPEDPRQWARYLTVGWLSTDSILVTYGPEVTFLSREDSVGATRVIYRPR